MENIAFFEELMETLSKDNEEENVCLISQEPLDSKNKIQLSCGHTFNLENLFKEIYRQKKVINIKETQRLKIFQIKCPYCRKIHDNLLPYVDGYDKIYGVNSPVKYCMYLHECSAILKSGKRRGEMCNKKCNSEFCKVHTKLQSGVNENNCGAILKSGKRKGLQCKSNAKKEGYCMLHYKKINNTN
jgi:hypothetical protein